MMYNIRYWLFRFFSAVWNRLSPIISNDALYIKVFYFLKTNGSSLNLHNPRLFTEKIQWLKLNAFKPEFSVMVDKISVKDYVKQKIGEDFIIPTIGVWNSVGEIDWEKLPQKFVLKNSVGSGGYDVVICRDKSTFNKDAAIKKLSSTFDNHSFWYGREKPYKDIKPRIIAEKLLEYDTDQCGEDLPDYKFYCFNGQPMYCQVIRNRGKNECIDFYDMDWNLMPFVGLTPSVRNGDSVVEKPINLDVMIDISTKLSNGIPFTRIDLYNIQGVIYFGEITFYPNSGFGTFHPKDWNLKLGELIRI